MSDACSAGVEIGDVFSGEVDAVGQDTAGVEQAVGFVHVAVAVVILVQLESPVDVGGCLAHVALDVGVVFGALLAQAGHELGWAVRSASGLDARVDQTGFGVDAADVLDALLGLRK